MKERLDDTNWVVWRELIRRIFAICDVEPYVYGQLKCPDSAVDRQMAHKRYVCSDSHREQHFEGPNGPRCSA